MTIGQFYNRCDFIMKTLLNKMRHFVHRQTQSKKFDSKLESQVDFTFLSTDSWKQICPLTLMNDQAKNRSLINKLVECV